MDGGNGPITAGHMGVSSLVAPWRIYHTELTRYRGKQSEHDYLPPPPFVPLNPSSISSQLPALLHAFYNARLESGMGISEDDPFDHAHSQIGSMGQIVMRNAPGQIKKKPREDVVRKPEPPKVRPKREP